LDIDIPIFCSQNSAQGFLDGAHGKDEHSREEGLSLLWRWRTSSGASFHCPRSRGTPPLLRFIAEQMAPHGSRPVLRTRGRACALLRLRHRCLCQAPDPEIDISGGVAVKGTRRHW